MHKHIFFIFIFLFPLSFSHAMEEDSKNKIQFKKIGTLYNSVDTQYISLNGNFLIGLEKIHEWRQIGFQFAHRFIGQEHATVTTHFFNKNIAVSIFAADDQEKYVLFSHKKKLFILPIHSKNHTKIKFPNIITALAIDPKTQCFAVGQDNGELSLHEFEEDKGSVILSRHHKTRITTLQFNETTLLSCDVVGKNYLWKNIWNDKRDATELHTRLPAIRCQMGKKFIALQHANNLIEYPKISIIDKETRTSKRCFGTLINITQEDELLIEQNRTNLFCVSPEGTILDRYNLPENCSFISNKKSGQIIPFLLKQETKENDYSKSELLMPIFNQNN